MNKNKGGRPTKYKDEYCNKLIKHMEKGLSFESFAAVVRVNIDTLYHWCKLFPKFSEAKKIATAMSMKFWEETLIEIAKGEHKGNVAAVIFSMTNRFKDIWKHKQEVETTHNYKPVVIKINEDEAIEHKYEEEEKRVN